MLRRSSLRYDQVVYSSLILERWHTTNASSTPTLSKHTSGNVDRMRLKLAEREFFQSVLGASATKRDAKNFLAHFGGKQKHASPKIEAPQQADARVNLGGLYRPNKAVENSPIFSFKSKDEPISSGDNTLNVAIVKISDPQKLETGILAGVAKTLAQLAKLGVRISVVLSFSLQEQHTGTPRVLSDIYQYSQAFTELLNDANDAGARLVDQSFAVESGKGQVTMPIQSILLSPLRKGVIAVVPPLAYCSVTGKTQVVNANSLILALTRCLSMAKTATEAPWPIKISLNRIIFLDAMGGLPDPNSASHTHIFVNLAQEYSDIYNQLKKQVNTDVTQVKAYRRHLDNLEIISKSLSQLPLTASALLATPLEIAMSATQELDRNTSTGVSTRPTRNTLIHNILTDKPLVSSSLPRARRYGVRPIKGPKSTATFFKAGMPVRIVPDPSQGQWCNPGSAGSHFDLKTDPRIDLPKLVHLIEDSFGRKLDVDHYLSRVERHVAGVIIAGDYEGGAILTWEKPLDRSHRPLVPYLDKFAVLRRCQGSGGVADIVFNAMVKQCFPEAVVWRSRRDNPVNKWYFERSNGTWQLPSSAWTMFWTGHEVGLKEGRNHSPEKVERWKDYVNVCSKIQPSWADATRLPE